MAGSSLLALIDDIATLLDDVAVMSKVAVKKTAGVLGDDLALNADQLTGMSPDRELPVVWAVAKGSFLNKAILVPGALLISAILPAAIVPLLMLGGLFLCYEGFEKVTHKLFHKNDAADNARERAKLAAAALNSAADLVAFEKQKIKGAIRTDFILSAEITIIALGTVRTAPLLEQVSVLVAISLVITVAVYGLVAGIVKLGDVGLYLRRFSDFRAAVGGGILRAAPRLMKGLSIAGTAAMFMVGGGILTHGVASVGHWIESVAEGSATIPGVGFLFRGLTSTALNALAGVVAGGVVFAGVEGVRKVWGRRGPGRSVA